ncbi:hypothetical protein GPALN_012116 [Globodera pallida]|nr:hypothetical protein GPALN_012116 [Globodera pallida]
MLNVMVHFVLHAQLVELLELPFYCKHETFQILGIWPLGTLFLAFSLMALSFLSFSLRALFSWHFPFVTFFLGIFPYGTYFLAFLLMALSSFWAFPLWHFIS